MGGKKKGKKRGRIGKKRGLEKSEKKVKKKGTSMILCFSLKFSASCR
jgi:hypothetical protein